MRIALAQTNSFLGDFAGNKAKIMDFVHRAHGFHCDMVVFPEAALFGYHPADLLERPSIVAQQEAFLKQIHKEIPKGVGVFVGAIVKNTSKKGKSYWNAAVFLEKGQKPKIFPQEFLASYDVFDESRHIEPGKLKNYILKLEGKKIVSTVFEDIWVL